MSTIKERGRVGSEDPREEAEILEPVQLQYSAVSVCADLRRELLRVLKCTSCRNLRGAIIILIREETSCRLVSLGA